MYALTTSSANALPECLGDLRPRGGLAEARVRGHPQARTQLDSSGMAMRLANWFDCHATVTTVSSLCGKYLLHDVGFAGVETTQEVDCKNAEAEAAVAN